MQQFLAEQTEQIEEYDESLVRRVVEKITVYEEEFTVEFKSGTSVDVDRRLYLQLAPCRNAGCFLLWDSSRLVNEY